MRKIKKTNKVFFVFKTSFAFFLFITFFAFNACVSSPSTTTTANANSGTSAADAMAMAQDALNRMDGGGGTQVSGQSNTQQKTQQSTPAQSGANVSVSTGGKPAWVDSIDSVYSRSQYLAMVGYGSSREIAEKNAIANIVSYFDLNVEADQKIRTIYQEVSRNGATTEFTKGISVDDVVKTSSSMNNLIGSEIKAVWQDTKGNTFYAAAVMDKAVASSAYKAMISANIQLINNIITMPASEKNTLDGYSRYIFSASIADINTSFVKNLNVLGAAPPAGVKSGDEFRLEAVSITKAIPIAVIVKNDKSNRIRGAFSKSLTDIGFRSGGDNSRYVLYVDVQVGPVEIANSPNKWARMELSANLTDTKDKSVLLPYDFNQREGHNTQSEAENRTFTTAERKINDEYKTILSNYLSQLLPMR